MTTSESPLTDDLAEAQDFVAKRQPEYVKLVEAVKQTCESAKTDVGFDVMKEIYSRGDKQPYGELKATHKLPKALRKERKAKQERGDLSETTFDDIGDIIGVTVVVQYPDQIQKAFEAITRRLDRQEIRPRNGEAPKEKRDFGYYAWHAVYRSEHPDHHFLCCEVQCKTMLHDAWATKMHDLTYKPIGFLDDRLAGLMQTFGDNLQLFEDQSLLIRDMIRERWEVEAERRHAARSQLVSWITPAASDTRSAPVRPAENDPHAVPVTPGPRDDRYSPGFRALLKEIKDLRDELARVGVNDLVVKTMTRRVNGHPVTKERWMLASYLASLRPRPDLSRYLETHVERWLADVRAQVEHAEFAPSILGAAPLTLHGSGDLDQAVAYYRRLNNQHKRYKIKPEDLTVLRFNMANALIERQYFDRSGEEDLEAHSREIDELIADCETSTFLKAASGAIEDTRGFKLIAFASEPDVVQEGIRQCERAKPASRDAHPLSWDYIDLHIRLGWRRLFELEQFHRR